MLCEKKEWKQKVYSVAGISSQRLRLLFSRSFYSVFSLSRHSFIPLGCSCSATREELAVGPPHVYRAKNEEREAFSAPELDYLLSRACPHYEALWSGYIVLARYDECFIYFRGCSRGIMNMWLFFFATVPTPESPRFIMGKCMARAYIFEMKLSVTLDYNYLDHVSALSRSTFEGLDDEDSKHDWNPSKGSSSWNKSETN